MAETRIQRRTREQNERHRYRSALQEIREIVKRQQLPITSQIFAIADNALKPSR